MGLLCTLLLLIPIGARSKQGWQPSRSEATKILNRYIGLHCPYRSGKPTKRRLEGRSLVIPCLDIQPNSRLLWTRCFFTVTSTGGPYARVLRGVVSTTSEGGFHRASIPCLKAGSRTQRVESTMRRHSTERQNRLH
jgi:hypothetical protein